MEQVGELSDGELVRKTVVLRGREKDILHELLLYLGEVDERGLYREEGYSSLFVYLRDGLGYSEGGACRRAKVARCIRRHPEVYGALVEGELSLGTACELARAEGEEGFPELLKRSLGKTLLEVSKIVARPKVVKRAETIRVIRKVRGEEAPLISNTSTAKMAEDVGYSVSLKVDEEFMRLYQEVKELTGGGSMREVFLKVLGDYSKRNSPKERQKRREARAEKRAVDSNRSKVAADPGLHRRLTAPRNDGCDGCDGCDGSDRREKNTSLLTPPVITRERSDRSNPVSAATNRHIPTATKDNVYVRDGGRCTYTSPSGKRCSCTMNLQFDHVTPFALGGDHSSGNLRLLCPAHNQLMAEQVFGKEHMARFRIIWHGLELPNGHHGSLELVE